MRPLIVIAGAFVITAGCSYLRPSTGPSAPNRCSTKSGWVDSSNGCSARAGYPDCYLVCPDIGTRKRLWYSGCREMVERIAWGTARSRLRCSVQPTNRLASDAMARIRPDWRGLCPEMQRRHESYENSCWVTCEEWLSPPPTPTCEAVTRNPWRFAGGSAQVG